ncbi:glycoside hydrolase family 16 protein [Nocardioides jensenii]|uniref:glycoside hydrolase family 16 protein n=1 Tax=Nocardioides jensenii TaxID=1843 RepID=UPI000833D7CE|nr:glycoside hydrolase family 16 protein [Nocardioides jensenii]
MKRVLFRRAGLGAAVLAVAVIGAPVSSGGAPALAAHSSDRAAVRLAAAAPAAPVRAASAAPYCGPTVIKSSGEAWACTFVENFGTSRLDTDKWIVQRTATSNFTTGVTDGARACYLDHPSAVRVAGGALRLSVFKATSVFTCNAKVPFQTRYAAGMVSTHWRFSQTYGRFEVRARIPSSREPGLQETLWLWPDDPTKYGAHPDSGEIDFAEFYSQYPDHVIPRIHYSYDPATVNWLTSTNIVTSYNCRIDQTAWNTYAVEWEPGRLTILVNGDVCLVDNYQADNTTVPFAPFNAPFMVVLTQALGHGSNALTSDAALPATTYVDYVRVWR